MEANRRERKRKRWVRRLGWLATGLVVSILLLPLWFPWVLAPTAKRLGLRYAAYDRIGFSRFAVTAVRGEWAGIELTVGRAESVLPTTWLWRKLNWRTNASPSIALEDVHLNLARAAPVDGQAGSAGQALDAISEIGRALERWVPSAALTDGVLQVASNRVTVRSARWGGGQLEATVEAAPWRGEIEIVGRVSGKSAVHLAVRSQWQAASMEGEFLRRPDGWHGEGKLGWLTNRAEFAAQFSTNGWWPTRAQLDGRRWVIPAKLLRLDGYENLIASLSGRFVSNRFEVQATGFAHPTSIGAERGFPEATFVIGADGDPSGIRLRTLDIQSPGLSGALTNTVRLTWTGELEAEPAQLRISADLGKLPGYKLAGKLAGLVEIEPQGETLPPSVRFRFSVHELGGLWVNPKTLSIRGRFIPPNLTLDEARADFGDGTAVVSGAFDFGTRAITNGRWNISGNLLESLWPSLSYAAMAASGELDGPVTKLGHRGKVAITGGRLSGMKPFDVTARWAGENQTFASAELQWMAGEAALSVQAGVQLDLGERRGAATLRQFSLHRSNEVLYSLHPPCSISFSAGGPDMTRRGDWTLAVDSFRWQGARRSLSASADLTWPWRGDAVVSMTNVGGAEFSGFVDADISGVAVSEFGATAHWSNGPVHAAVLAAGFFGLGSGRVDLNGRLRFGDVLTIEHAILSRGFAPGLSVTGTVPVKVILPARRMEFFRWEEAQPIALAARWEEASTRPVTVPLGTRGALEISQPHISLHIAGTRLQPKAEVVAGLASVAWQTTATNALWPTLGDVRLKLEVQPDEIQLQTFSAKVDGQPATAAGSWPIARQAWTRWWSAHELPDWSRAHGRVELNEAQIAAWSSYLPKLASPEGQFSAALELKPGKVLAGIVSLTNAATRSIGRITPVRDVAARVRFEGGRAALEAFHGQIGGQPVRADGYVSVAKLDGSGLDYLVNLRGSNVPLARSPEWLLRGDMDLSFRGVSNRPPTISGAVTLHDGLFVQHASDLFWHGPRRPEWRPPYFSVTNEPFDQWRLDLAVRGDRFLRVRTPVFNGTVSADLQVGGSLVSPILTGDARVSSGRLLFPFGALALSQGVASFTGADSRGPDVQINASGRSYRYDLRLEVKGPADGANIVFSSTPPLASEEILLMLTAGELPESDFAFSGSARAGHLATFLGKDLLSRYLGSDPAEERLILRSGESISKDGRLTYSVEYRLSDRWSIIGEYDEFNAFNTDLKWKLFTR